MRYLQPIPVASDLTRYVPIFLNGVPQQCVVSVDGWMDGYMGAAWWPSCVFSSVLFCVYLCIHLEMKSFCCHSEVE